MNVKNVKHILKSFHLTRIFPICLVILCVIVILLFGLKKGKNSENDDKTNQTEVQLDSLKDVNINLGTGMYITSVGKYVGVYMEDGSNEKVSDVLMITVQNKGEEAIQYAEIIMPAGKEDAYFTLSTLTPGSTMILLEQNRMNYADEDYTTAIAQNVVVFSEELSFCKEQVEIQILDGVINVSNISGGDIDGDIVVYYKNSAEDVFYGGITYRARIEGGLQKGEIRQIMAGHCSKNGSTIMFVTCGGN